MINIAQKTNLYSESLHSSKDKSSIKKVLRNFLSYFIHPKQFAGTLTLKRRQSVIIPPPGLDLRRTPTRFLVGEVNGYTGA